MLVGFAASGFKMTGGLQSENVGATLKIGQRRVEFRQEDRSASVARVKFVCRRKV